MRLFVLIRDDLESTAYKGVQGGHAVGEFMIKHGAHWNNDYLIYLRVKNLEQLELWKVKLEMKNYKMAPFHEPDLDNELTAIACVPENERFFDKLSKLE